MKKTDEYKSMPRYIYNQEKEKNFQFKSEFTELTKTSPQWTADLFWWIYHEIEKRLFTNKFLRYFVNSGRQDGILSRSDWKYLMRLI